MSLMGTLSRFRHPVTFYLRLEVLADPKGS